MRRFAITLAILSICLVALGQGKITFGNDSTRLFVLDGAPIPPSPLPNGRSLIAALYAGTSAGTMTLQTYYVLDAANWGPTPGRMVPHGIILSGVPGGALAFFNIVVSDVVGLLGSPYPGFPSGNALYWGSTGNFTATPGASISYPFIYQPTAPVNSTWAPGYLEVGGCLSCGFKPWFEVNPSSQSVALGSDVTLYALARSYADCCYPMGYAWRKNGATIDGANTPSLILTNVQFSDAGNYDVVAYNGYGVTFSSVATLTVFGPAIAATLGSPAYTTNHQFQFTVTGTAGTNYIVQVSTNLATTDWVSLFTNASPFTFVDTNANSFPRRFYRAYSP